MDRSCKGPFGTDAFCNIDHLYANDMPTKDRPNVELDVDVVTRRRRSQEVMSIEQALCHVSYLLAGTPD